MLRFGFAGHERGRIREGTLSGPSGAVKRPQRFPYVNRVTMVLLDGRAGRLTAKNGGFRPG